MQKKRDFTQNLLYRSLPRMLNQRRRMKDALGSTCVIYISHQCGHLRHHASLLLDEEGEIANAGRFVQTCSVVSPPCEMDLPM